MKYFRLLEPTLEFVSFGLFQIFMIIGGMFFVALLRPIIKRAYGFIMISVFKIIIRNDKRLGKDVTLHFHETGLNIHSVSITTAILEKYVACFVIVEESLDICSLLRFHDLL